MCTVSHLSPGESQKALTPLRCPASPSRKDPLPMAFVTDKDFVDIPPVTEKHPPNPLLGYDGRRTAPPSATSSASMSQSTLAHRVLLYDQRCLVTGGVSDQIQACHLINTIRMGKSNRQEKTNLKNRVEYILTRQQFGIGDFFLDSLPNCVALEAQVHGTLDTYGSICITIPFDQILGITRMLTLSNIDWRERAASNPQAQRNLNMQADPFVLKKCVLLVLRPELFLSESRPLLINTRRVFRNPGETITPMHYSAWTLYRPQNYSPYLLDSSSQSYREFDYQSNRPPGQGPSVFSLLVNANSKLQAAKRRNTKRFIHRDITLYIAAVELAIQEIFFFPNGLQNQAEGSSLIPPVPSFPPGLYYPTDSGN